MKVEIEAIVETWHVLTVKSRVDASNQKGLTQEINELRLKGVKKVALDLRSNRFFSYQAIRFFVDAARELSAEGGQLALIGCPQKTKRHFEIYGSLAHILNVRSEHELGGAVESVRRNDTSQDIQPFDVSTDLNDMNL